MYSLFQEGTDSGPKVSVGGVLEAIVRFVGRPSNKNRLFEQIMEDLTRLTKDLRSIVFSYVFLPQCTAHPQHICMPKAIEQKFSQRLTRDDVILIVHGPVLFQATKQDALPYPQRSIPRDCGRLLLRHEKSNTPDASIDYECAELLPMNPYFRMLRPLSAWSPVARSIKLHLFYNPHTISYDQDNRRESEEHGMRWLVVQCAHLIPGASALSYRYYCLYGRAFIEGS